MHVLAHFQHRFHLVAAITSRILKIARNVSAGTETATGSGDDDGSGFVVVARVAKHSDDFVNHQFGICIQLRRTIKRDCRDTVFFGVNDFGEFHIAFLVKPANYADDANDLFLFV